VNHGETCNPVTEYKVLCSNQASKR